MAVTIGVLIVLGFAVLVIMTVIATICACRQQDAKKELPPLRQEEKK